MKNKTIIFLIIVILLASFFRLWQLDTIPPGLYPDEAINSNQGWQALESRDFKVFYPENNGREGLFINLLGFSFSAFGINIFSLRVVSAVFGILAVLAIFLFTKEILYPVFKKREREIIAFLASFFLATSFWHTNFSRISFRAIMVPFILPFSLYFLFKGFRTKKIRELILGGVFFGIGFHTYISFRLAILLLGIVLFCWLLIYFKKKLLKKFIFFSACFLFFTFVVALPIGFYFYQNPQDFISRATPISVFAQDSPVKSLAISFFQHLAMFNIYGDPNWRHNLAGSPMLPIPLGILFLVGIAISIKKTVALIKEKDFLKLTAFLTLGSWFFIMLLPGILTFEGLPHALRVIGVIPVVYIFLAIGTWEVGVLIKKKLKKKQALFIFLIITMATMGTYEFHKYFFRWSKNPEAEAAFTQRFVKIGNYLNDLSPETKKYVIKNDGDLPVETITFIQKTKNKEKETIYLYPHELNKIKTEQGRTVIILTAYDYSLFQEIKRLFPQGEIKNENDVHVYNIIIK